MAKVASSRKNRAVPAVAPGSGTKPVAWDEPDPTKTLRVDCLLLKVDQFEALSKPVAVADAVGMAATAAVAAPEASNAVEAIVALDPNPKLVRAVEELAKSLKLLAAFKGAKPKAFCFPVNVAKSAAAK